MATMFPEEIDGFTTTGEERVYKFLQHALKPDSLFIVWYSPDIKGREPDFIMYSSDSGLIVFEVKDWAINQILQADPKFFRLQMGNKEESRTNPSLQAKRYVHELMKAIGKVIPHNQGEKVMLPCPIMPGVILPNISREEYLKANLNKVMSAEQILFGDELHYLSPLYTDETGRTPQEWFKKAFPPRFAFSHSLQQLDLIRSVLFPVVRIETPTRSGRYSAIQTEEQIRLLDNAQEQLARNFTSGKRLIIGPSGSGKTLILVHQAWQLLRSSHKVKRILITCFNLSLVGYIRRLLATKQIPVGNHAVEVIPFYDVCEKVLGEQLVHSQEQGDYYEFVVQETLEHIKQGKSNLEWDAILIDEGQDFSQDMAQVMLGLLNKEHGVLTVVQDENQALYQEQEVWQSLDIEILKTTRLEHQYRCTKEISLCASKVLDTPLDPKFIAGPKGNKVNFLQAESNDELITALAQAVLTKVEQGIPMSEIAILYTKTFLSNSLGEKIHFPERIIEELESQGLLCLWPVEDERAKRRYDITTDSITISTVYSVKGMDFSSVFLVGLEDLSVNSIRDRRLAYVGMTRARYDLNIAYIHQKGIV